MPIATDIAGLLSQQIASGSGSARVTLGGKSVAYAWCNSVVNGAISLVDTAVAESTTFKATVVENDTDVTAWTTSDKPITASIVVSDVALATYPGAVEIKTRDVLDSHNLGQAVSVALYGQALKALDSALVTALKGGAPTVAKAADIAGIAEAQAQLLAQGFNPGVTIVSAAVYADLAGKALLVGGNDPQQAQQSVLGSRIAVSSALTGSQAIVLDPMAVVAVEHAQSPVVLMQTHARRNVTEVVVEVVGGFVIAQDLGVVSVYSTT